MAKFGVVHDVAVVNSLQ